MRMDQSHSTLTASYVVNNVAEEEIARILYTVYPPTFIEASC